MRSALAVLVLLIILTACSAGQRAAEKAALKCTGAEWSEVQAELDSADSTETKVLKISADAYACFQLARAAKAAAAGSGAAGSAR